MPIQSGYAEDSEVADVAIVASHREVRHPRNALRARAALAVASLALALSALEAKEVRRRLEGGTAVLAFGEPALVDERGRPAGSFLPGGKAVIFSA